MTWQLLVHLGTQFMTKKGREVCESFVFFNLNIRIKLFVTNKRNYSKYSYNNWENSKNVIGRRFSRSE